MLKTIWSPKVRLIAGALLLMTIVSTGGYGTAAAGPNAIPVAAPEGQMAPGDPLTSQIIIKYLETANATDSNGQIKAARMSVLSTAAGETLTYERPMSGDAHVVSLPAPMPAASVEATARRLAALPGVEYAEPDTIMSHTLVPNDSSYGAQWHYFGPQGINAPAAWDITTGEAAVRVAVIDTGITDHPDLAGRWIGGYDFIGDVAVANDGNGRDSDPHDPGDWVAANFCGLGAPAQNSSWHGTHVAGTIGAASNNGLGVTGINWVSPIVPVRVLGRCGGYTSDIVDGMRWSAGLAVTGVPANANPAKVLNLSLGGSGTCGTSYQNAINAINAAGAIVVIAAGNSNANASNFQPANCSGVVTVAATDRDGNRAFYSNYGAVVEISAPGGETNTNSPSPAPQNGVLSTLNAGLTTPGAASYTYYQGTSMAAPHIAGVLSLMVSLDPTLNFTQSLQILQNTARAFPAGSTCTTSTCGSGIADAAAALNAVLNPGTPTPTGTATPTGVATGTPTPTNTPGGATSTPTPKGTRTPTPTHTPGGATSTPTPTNTPGLPTSTPTPTNTPGSVTSTGFLAPSANAPQASKAGDLNGYEGSPTNAYAADELFATDANSGTGTSTSCTHNTKDKHSFYDYNFNIPTLTVVNGIEVRLNAKADGTSDAPKICIQLSWNGGASWTAAQSTSTLTTSNATYTLGTPTYTWGRSWAQGNFSNANFRVRVIDVAGSTARTFSLDSIAVNVTYQP